MLILLLLFTLFRLLRGAPTAAIAEVEPGPYFLPGGNLLSRNGIVFGTRTTSDIVTSCLATIFACTWTAIHPNIPSPADSRWDIFKRRLVTTIYALLAPEFITIWAYRQYFGAKKIVEDYNSNVANKSKPNCSPQKPWYQWPWVDFKEWLFCAPPFYPTRKGEIHPWTITHGFFIQMGGFVLSENGIPKQTLRFTATFWPNCNIGIDKLISAGHIDAPKITQAEIEDRSKGDVISKTIVILQTTWFIAQCIARWFTRLPVTELEIVTLGFAILNGITYALWWHKPQNVGVPVYLEAKAQLSSNFCSNNGPLASGCLEAESGIQLPQPSSETSSNNRKTMEELEHLVPKKLNDTRQGKASFLPRKLKKDWVQGYRTWGEFMFSILKRLIQAVLHPLSKLSDGNLFTFIVVDKKDLRVPMFFAENDTDVYDNAYFFGVVATLFGCIHLVPSFFLHYASPMEMWFWRISAALITIQPFLTCIGIAIRKLSLHRLIYLPGWIEDRAMGLFKVLIPLYIVARLALIVLSFLSLRDLPGDAHKTIDWISSIPHL